MSSLGCLLSSVLMSTDRSLKSDERQIWTCTQSKLRSRTKPGCVRSLSYDPVNVWPRIRQSESTLALHSNQTSARFRVNIRISPSRIAFKFSSFVLDFRIRNCKSESETLNTNPKPTWDRLDINLKLYIIWVYHVLNHVVFLATFREMLSHHQASVNWKLEFSP